MKHKLDFETSYSQFYIVDKDAEYDTGNDFWNKTAYSDRLGIDNGIVAVLSQSYGPIKANISIIKKENTKIDYNEFDHIVQASLKIESGVLQVLDCPNSDVQFEINITPGIYTVRVYSSNLNIEDEYVGGDFYEIEVWQSSYGQRIVLKQYSA